MSKNSLITIVLLIIAGGLGFFAGSKYQSAKIQTAFGNRQFGNFNGQRMGNGNGNNIRNGFGGRQTIGEITSVDNNSVTVKMPDGSSRIVILTDKTTISKSADGSRSDLKTGETVAVFGAANSDGSVTATNVQLNPAFRMMGLTSTPAQK